jgi:hypothetical protein
VSWRFAAAIFFASMAFGQNAREAEIALAAKSPNALARYVESHRTIDWKALRTALGLTESTNWRAPCGVDSPVVDAPCSAEMAVSEPDQTILLIRGREFSESRRGHRGKAHAAGIAGEALNSTLANDEKR